LDKIGKISFLKYFCPLKRLIPVYLF